MKDILRELFYGNIQPQEQYYPSKEDNGKLAKRAYSSYEGLKEKLEKQFPEAASEFDNFVNQHQEFNLKEMEEVFVRSFCLGARMMLEILSEDIGT